jgi:hypothetical protein
LDCNAVAEKLANMQQTHLQLRQCSLEQVLDVISLLRMPRQPTNDSESDSNSELPDSSSRPDDKPQLPSLAGLSWLISTPNIAPGQCVRLLPLSISNVNAVSAPSPPALPTIVPTTPLSARVAHHLADH